MAPRNGPDLKSSHKISEKCATCAHRVVWDNLWINLGLAVAKGVVGDIAGSKAVVADAVHSLSDVITSLVVGLSLKIADRPSDEDHAYGHGQVEYLAVLLVSGVLLAAAVMICVSAITTILHRVPVQPSMLAVWVVAISIIANELMFRRTICAAEKVNSPSLRTNAWDNRVDSYSSIATLLGILGAKLGIHFLDPLAAVIVAFFIFRVCGQMMWDALRGLSDVSAASPEQLRQIYDITRGVDGVQHVTDIRTRRLGKALWIDVRIQISGRETLAEGHLIVSRIRDALMSRVAHVGKVLVAVDAGEKSRVHTWIR